MMRSVLVVRWSVCWWRCAAPALAQLPADAVMLDKVKIAEKQKSVDLCPVYLEPSDPKLPTWEYKGVKYRGSKPDAAGEVPEGSGQVRQGRREAAVRQQLHAVDEHDLVPGDRRSHARRHDAVEAAGLHLRKLLHVLRRERSRKSNFAEALKRLKERAEKTYELIGAKYTEGAKSPVEGAIKKPEE